MANLSNSQLNDLKEFLDNTNFNELKNKLNDIIKNIKSELDTIRNIFDSNKKSFGNINSDEDKQKAENALNKILSLYELDGNIQFLEIIKQNKDNLINYVNDIISKRSEGIDYGDINNIANKNIGIIQNGKKANNYAMQINEYVDLLKGYMDFKSSKPSTSKTNKVSAKFKKSDYGFNSMMWSRRERSIGIWDKKHESDKGEYLNMDNNNWHVYMNSDSLLDSRNNLSLKKAIPSLNNVDDITYKNVINLLRCYILFHDNENFNTKQLSNVITGGHPELMLFGVDLKNNIKYISIENDESLNDIDFDVKKSPKIVYACIEYKGKNIKIPLGINVQLTNDTAYVYSQGMFSQKSTVDINHSNHKQINHKPLNKLNNDIRIINEGHIITTDKIKSNDFDKDVTDDNDNNSGQTYSWIESVKGRAMIAISDDIYGNDDYFNKMNKPIRHNGKITNMYDNSKIQ